MDSTTRELIADSLARIANGDVSAQFDPALTFMAHADKKDVAMNLAVIEALATTAKTRGCGEAEKFLKDQWPDMQAILRKRWERAGFV